MKLQSKYIPLAATISLVNYGPSFGFLGFYICRPDLRGKGLGLVLPDQAHIFGAVRWHRRNGQFRTPKGQKEGDGCLCTHGFDIGLNLRRGARHGAVKGSAICGHGEHSRPGKRCQ